MRYWNEKYIAAQNISDGLKTNVQTKEECMDLCLERSDCPVFVYYAQAKQCYLKRHGGPETDYETTVVGTDVESWAYLYTSGVRCHLTAKSDFPADGIHPAGKNLFILFVFVKLKHFN